MNNKACLLMLPGILASICATAGLTSFAFAQEEVDRTLEEIIVVGTWREGRTVTNLPVPMDVFRGEDR